ncbi:glycan biosynthesis hexose transferase WsfD [Clostridium sp.]|uniref:glycan biosynthesis hexose transferase WsfD n=2 Tax=Clostridium sp. TaxID=1506 RepID=UPI002FDE3AFB
MFIKIYNVMKRYLIEIIILIPVIIILINTLFIYPIIGKCDNGDFERLFLYGGLSNLCNNYSEIYDGFVHIHYLISSPNIFLIFLLFYKNWVSGSILLKVAVVISLLVNNFSSNIFDIRYLAFVYSAIFTLSIFLILSFKRFSILLKLLAGIYIILIFTDTSYISYFNSFFGEAGTIVFFFLSIGTYLMLITKNNPEIRYFVYFFAASAVFLTSKAQEIPLFVFMIIVYIGLFIYYRDKKCRKCIMISSLVVFILCGISYISLTDRMNQNNMYQAVFSGILRGSENPEKDLEELGLNKKFIVFYGKSFYNKNSNGDPLGKDMMEQFYPNISPIKILCFYLKHPDRMWQKIQDSAMNAYSFYIPGKWNFAKGEYSTNKNINTFRTKLISRYPKLHHNIYIFILFSTVYICVVMIYLIKRKDKTTRLILLMLIFILAAGSSQFILPVIGSGHGDFGKHLFLLNLCYDTMFGISLLWCLSIIVKLLSYGITMCTGSQKIKKFKKNC